MKTVTGIMMSARGDKMHSVYKHDNDKEQVSYLLQKIENTVIIRNLEIPIGISLEIAAKPPKKRNCSKTTKTNTNTRITCTSV